MLVSDLARVNWLWPFMLMDHNYGHATQILDKKEQKMQNKYQLS